MDETAIRLIAAPRLAPCLHAQPALSGAPRRAYRTVPNPNGENAMEQRPDYVRVRPEGYRAFGRVHQYVAQCGLEPALLDLVYLRVSQNNGCAFCVALLHDDALKAGVWQSKLNSSV